MDAIAPVSAREHEPRLWGLTPVQVSDRFWASRGVQVIRRGSGVLLASDAELFLLTDAYLLVLFRLRDLVELLSWLAPKLVMLRLNDHGGSGYGERIRSTPDGDLVGSERIYDGLDSRIARVGLTADRGVAAVWQRADSASAGWRSLRGMLPRDRCIGRRMSGRVFDGRRPDQVMAHLECLMDLWVQPSSTIPRVREGPSSSWVDRDARVAEGASVLGPLWVGAGRTIAATEAVLGPAILWDSPEHGASSEAVPWHELEPASVGAVSAAPRRVPRPPIGKRVFDVLFSVVALALTLPLYPIIMLAIWLEDGWPLFFAHRRETVGGREFPCLKFRSMRRDAEQIKEALAARNVADGPQFYVESDPRSTRVGRFLRASQLDELPQFWNVLLGHMSVVGPRPSPRKENQYCPAWREARLSVRPGVTGLWQIRRTRAEGRDFQEWIQYDLEYVARMSWALDLWIILRTVGTVLRRALGR